MTSGAASWSVISSRQAWAGNSPSCRPRLDTVGILAQVLEMVLVLHMLEASILTVEPLGAGVTLMRWNFVACCFAVLAACPPSPRECLVASPAFEKKSHLDK